MVCSADAACPAAEKIRASSVDVMRQALEGNTGLVRRPAEGGRKGAGLDSGEVRSREEATIQPGTRGGLWRRPLEAEALRGQHEYSMSMLALVVGLRAGGARSTELAQSSLPETDREQESFSPDAASKQLPLMKRRQTADAEHQEVKQEKPVKQAGEPASLVGLERVPGPAAKRRFLRRGSAAGNADFEKDARRRVTIGKRSQ
ncbi:hypothetical protein PO909_018209 [Leuciscus waleckii]